MKELDQLEIREPTRGMFLTFRIDQDLFGIDINAVTEIVGVEDITHLPELPHYIKGILNVRGIDVPVMDVRRRFQKEPREIDAMAGIVIVDLEELGVGLLVDSIAGVLSVTAEDILKLPKIGLDPVSACLRGIGRSGNQIILILDIEKLFTQEELQDITARL